MGLVVRLISPHATLGRIQPSSLSLCFCEFSMEEDAEYACKIMRIRLNSGVNRHMSTMLHLTKNNVGADLFIRNGRFVDTLASLDMPSTPGCLPNVSTWHSGPSSQICVSSCTFATDPIASSIVTALFAAVPFHQLNFALRQAVRSVDVPSCTIRVANCLANLRVRDINVLVSLSQLVDLAGESADSPISFWIW